MAITGKFAADFTDFLDAVRRSEIALGDMSKGASGVESKLNSMVDNFSGRRVIQEATLMSIALEAAGGTSILTGKQLEAVSQKASDAADKMRALGYEVPPGLQKLADAVDDAKGRTEGWIPIIKALGDSWVARIAEGVLLRDAIRGIVDKVGELASALPQLALKGAAVADISDNFKTLTQDAGLLGNVLLGSLRAGTHDTVTDLELMKTVNKDLGAGLVLSTDQFKLMAQGAFALAQSTGVDVKQAFDKLNEAMLTGRVRAAADLIGKVDAQAAEEKYANALGGTAKQLTEAQKIEAGRAAILEGTAQAVARLGEQTDGLDERVAQAAVAWENFTNNLGAAIANSEVLKAGLDGIKAALEGAFGGSQQAVIQGIVSTVDSLLISVLQLGIEGVKAIGFLGVEFNAFKVVVGDVAQAFELLNLGAAKLQRFKLKSGDILGLDPATTAALKQVNADIDAMSKSIDARGKALQADKAAEIEWAEKGQKMADVLEEIKRKMETAKDGAKTLGDQELNLFGGVTTVTGAFVKHGDTLAKAKGGTDKFADAWKELNTNGGSLQATIDGIDGTVVEALKYYLEAGANVGTLAKAYELTETQVSAVDKAMKESEKSLQATIKDIEDFRKTGEDGAAAVARGFAGMPGVLKGLAVAMGDVQIAGKQFVGVMGLLPDLSIQAAQHIRNLSDTIGDDLVKSLQKIPDLMIKAFTGGGGLEGAFKAIGTMLAQDIIEPIMKGLTKAQQVAVSAGSAIAGGLGQAAGLGNTASAAIAVGTGLAGAAISASAWGTAMAASGVAGTVAVGAATLGIGAAAIGVALLIKHFMGVSDAVKQARADVAKFQDAMGGVQGTIDTVGKAYAQLGLTGDQAQAALKALWNTNAGAAAVDKAIADITDKLQRASNVAKILDGDFHDALGAGVAMGVQLPPALQATIQKLVDMGVVTGDNATLFAKLTGDQEVNFKTLSDIATKYGADLNNLGPKFEAARIGDTAKGIINDFDTLQMGLGDTDEALRIMRKPINDLVNDSIKFGVDIPANMKPWVEQLEKTGQLTDANGDQLTDLSKIKFGAPIADQFQILIDKISKLVDTIAGPGGLTPSLNNIPSKITTEIVTTHTDVYGGDSGGDTAAWGGGLVGPYGVQHAAFGGNVLAFPGQPRGLDRIPVWTAQGEGIVSRQGMGTIGAEGLAAINAGRGMGGGTTVVDTSRQAAETAALRQDLNDLARLLPKMIRDAVLLSPSRAA